MDAMDTEERGENESKRQNVGETDDVSSIESTIRFLVSNSAAGSVIGKGGATINEFQQQSGARIVLSRAREFFPGTSDRIILLSGTVSAILTALHLILSKVSEDGDGGGKGEDSSDRGASELRIVVPNKVCGAIIGKSGATIKSFVDDSGASIKLSSQDPSSSAVSERLVTIGGSLEQQLRAVALILTKMSEDPSYVQYGNVPLSFTAGAGAGGYVVGGGQGGGPRGGGGGYYDGPSRGRGPLLQSSSVTTTIIVAVPDEHVGAVVGKGGRSLQEIQQGSGVRMSISDRGDYVDGTSNRKVTITGTADGVVAAQHLIAQKVQQSINALDYNRGGRDRVDGYDRDRDRDRDRHDRDRGRRDRDDGDDDYDRHDRDRERGDRRRDERGNRW